MTGTATVIRGDALNLDIPDASVDLVVTSPPYFGLRSYQDNGEHYSGQIGAEPTPAEFVDALIAATREMMRVLKPSGSIWVNLGDKYSSTTAGANGNGSGASTLGHHKGGGGPHSEKLTAASASRRVDPGVPAKSLIGVPWRYALRCIDELGLILRAEVIWSKPNGLPESVTDRVRRSHETWFHMTKSPRYYSAVDEIREESATVVTSSGSVRYRLPGEEATANRQKKEDKYHASGMRGGYNGAPANPLGKLPGSVWTVPTQPLKVPAHLGVDHFAAYPMEFPRRIIRGWSPREVCTACGEGRRPVTTTTRIARDAAGAASMGHQDPRAKLQDRHTRASIVSTHEVTGYACDCPDTAAPSTPGVVLDPFGGTGTTALVAKALGRHGISNDLSADYCRLAEWRTTDPGELARAMEVEKPDPVHPDQFDLFGMEDTA